LYNELLPNYKFGPAHCVELLKRSPIKLSLQFLDLPISFYRFWKFELFLGILLNRKEKEKRIPKLGRDSGPRPQCDGARWPACFSTCYQSGAACSVRYYWPGPTVKAALLACSQAAYQPTVSGAGERALPCSHCMRRGAVPAGSPVAEVKNIGWGKHRC
jgi:hypothetical protein